MLASVSPPVVEETAFSVELIEALLRREVLAARLPLYGGSEICAHVARRTGQIEGEGYADEPTFKKVIGGAVYDAANDRRLLSHYLDMAPQWHDECQRAFSPFLNPVDLLRYELDSIWPEGCGVQRFMGRTGFAGLMRAFGAGAEARIHQDMTHWDIPHVREAQVMKQQLSCVLYFASSSQGGELELWDWGYTDPNDYESSKVPGDYAIDRARAGEPAAVLKPRPAEMIVFNSRNLHAVRRIQSEDKRITQSFFIAYQERDSELGLFS